MFNKKSAKPINLFNQHYDRLIWEVHTAQNGLWAAVYNVCRKQGALNLYLENSPDYNKAKSDLLSAKQHLHNAIGAFEDSQRQAQEYYKNHKDQMYEGTNRPIDKDSHLVVESCYQDWMFGKRNN